MFLKIHKTFKKTFCMGQVKTSPSQNVSIKTFPFFSKKHVQCYSIKDSLSGGGGGGL